MSTSDDIQKMCDKLCEDQHSQQQLALRREREIDPTLPQQSEHSLHQQLLHTPPPQSALLRTLQRAAFLQNTPPGACNEAQLIDLLAKGRVRTFAPGDALVRQGEPTITSDGASNHHAGGELYILYSGQVSVHVRKHDKQASVTKLSGRNYHHGKHNHRLESTKTTKSNSASTTANSPSDDLVLDSSDASSLIVGDTSLYTDSAPSSSIIADSEVHAYALPLSAVHSFIAKHPALAQNLATRRWLWSVLARNQHFRLADDDTRKQQLVQSFVCETKRKGDVVVRFGEPGDKFFVVERGECEIRVPYQSQGGRRSGRTLNVALSTQQANSQQQPQQQQSTPGQSATQSQSSIQQPADAQSKALTQSQSNTSSNQQSQLQQSGASQSSQLTEVRVATRGPSTTFGELSLLYSAPRSATVKCLSDSCTLWSVDGQLFAAACNEGSTFLRHTFARFASYRDETTKMYFMTAEDFYRAIEYTRSKRDPRQQFDTTNEQFGKAVDSQQQQQQLTHNKDDDSKQESHSNKQQHQQQQQQQQQQQKKDSKSRSSSINDAQSSSLSSVMTGSSPLTERQLRLIFELADQSGDQLISFSEFVLLFHLLRSKANNAQIAFKIFDRDRSGTIDKAEFIQVVSALLSGDKSNAKLLAQLSSDPFIQDLFDDTPTHCLTLAQFSDLLQRDVLPSYLTSLKADLKSLDTYTTELSNSAIMGSDGLSGMLLSNSGRTASQSALSGATQAGATHAGVSWKTLVTGGVAGAVSRTLVSPLERVKLLFQMQSNPPKYTGVLQSLRLIRAEDGIRGFFRGNLSNVVRITPTSAFQFWFYDFYSMIGANLMDQKTLGPWQRLLAGGLAGITAAILTYPLDFIRARLTYQSRGTAQYRGIVHGLVTVCRTEGPLTMYRGLWPSVVGIFPYIGIDFAVYDTLKSHLSPDLRQNKAAVLACGATAGIVGQTIAYPLDLVRRRMQVQGFGDSKFNYKHGIARTIAEIIRTEGVRALYRGMVPNYFKVVPAVSISFLVNEEMKKWIM